MPRRRVCPPSETLFAGLRRLSANGQTNARANEHHCHVASLICGPIRIRAIVYHHRRKRRAALDRGRTPLGWSLRRASDRVDSTDSWLLSVEASFTKLLVVTVVGHRGNPFQKGGTMFKPDQFVNRALQTAIIPFNSTKWSKVTATRDGRPNRTRTAMSLEHTGSQVGCDISAGYARRVGRTAAPSAKSSVTALTQSTTKTPQRSLPD
jgi:hypothetical protein